jgi:4-cresol dehydrogenase (hydroxylating)
MKIDKWKQACTAWAHILGEEHVLTDDQTRKAYACNVSGLKREIPVVLRPGTAEEVQAVVREANQFKTPLYPISTGMNWGLGSRLPVRENCAVLDMGRMNRILEVNAEQRYAVIEPGVTQKQLCDYLREHNIPLLLNVTGSAAESSIIGNSLERGVGYFASRADALSGMEVVLGTGEIIRTGFSHFKTCRNAHVYRHGVGPSLDGLFAQSNFGIVTKAGVELMPKPEVQTVFVIRIAQEEKLGSLIDALSGLLSRHIIDSVIHVGNQARSRIAMAPLVYDYLISKGMPEEEAREEADRSLELEGFGAWSALGGLMGTKKQVALAKREIRSAVRGIGRVTFLTPKLIRVGKRILAALTFLPTVHRKLAILSAVEKFYDYSVCAPSSAAMQSVCWPVEKKTYTWPYSPDATPSGALYVVPCCPIQSSDVTELVRHTNEICATFGFEPYITLNTLDCRSVEAVINIAFDRRDAERTRHAQACADKMLQRYIEVGMIPYRVAVQDMPRLVQESDPFWRTVRDLKTAVDPNHIISPGRYNLV